MRTIRDRYQGKARQIVYYEEADEMEIDDAEAILFVEAFDDERYWASKSFPAWDSAKILLNHGLVKLGRGKAADYDELARRSQYWTRVQERIGNEKLSDYLLRNAISEAEHKQLLEQMDAIPQSEPETGQIFDLFG